MTNLLPSKTLIRDIAIGASTALLFSLFLYLEHLGITLKLLNTLTALIALYALLHMPKKAILSAGFFIGLLWFYWIGYSFEYTDAGYITPLITLGFAVIYMLFFGTLALTNEPYLRALILFGLTFFEPMDFNWMQPELLFVESYIGIFKWQFALVLGALALPRYIHNRFKFTPLLLTLFAFNTGYHHPLSPSLKVKLVETHVLQEQKWLKSSLTPTIAMIFEEIDKAIKEGYDLIVLPESVFPLYLNRQPTLLEALQERSRDIAIVTGALLYEENQHYNVTFCFQNGEYTIAKKMILVPFGEYIPLPAFLRQLINDTFFAGAADFQTATSPTDFIIKGVKFRNAVCYEATCQELYEGDVKYLIATSNNAWFAPSIEPTLQNLLLRYYARKNGVTILHSANYRGSGIIQ